VTARAWLWVLFAGVPGVGAVVLGVVLLLVGCPVGVAYVVAGAVWPALTVAFLRGEGEHDEPRRVELPRAWVRRWR
jgi:hypothetical protein